MPRLMNGWNAKFVPSTHFRVLEQVEFMEQGILLGFVIPVHIFPLLTKPTRKEISSVMYKPN